MDTQQRLHSLDALRAFALLSGIVLHAAMTFMPGLAAFGFPADVSQSPQLQTVFFVIHIFRMSLFFFIGGYFARRMFHRDEPKSFVRDRLKRIGIPMLAGTIGCLWMLQRMPNPFAVEPTLKLAFAATYALAIWTWVFGLVGAATRFLTETRPSIRYLADASYWIYLAHLPVVFALQLAVLQWQLHWSVKFPLIVGTALGILLLSYHFCVRRTFIGRVLGGGRLTQPAKVTVMLAPAA